MSVAAFMLRGLWFFRKSYLGVLAGAALGAMVLLGALLAGDSVKATLRQMASARLGKVNAVLVGGDRFFRAALADDLTDSATPAAPVLMVKATASVQRSGRALGNVQVLGVDRRFWQLGPGADGAANIVDLVSAETGQEEGGGQNARTTSSPGILPGAPNTTTSAKSRVLGSAATPLDREFFVNEHLARSLDLGSNETLVLRFEKPGMIARDAPLAGKAAEVVALRGGVSGICGDARFGRFSLEATQLPQATVFVPLERLQQALGLAGKANLLLLQNRKGLGFDELLGRVTRSCTLEDYSLTVKQVPLANALEIRTARIFFDRKVAAVIQQRFPEAQPVITYMANTLAANGKTTPYSMVTAMDAAAAPFVPKQLDGVLLNSWEADDLGAKAGDEVRLDYYALDAANRLVERSAKLPVAGVVPLTGLAADPNWMPDFPGVASAEKAADWDAGVPIDIKRIRNKDDAYWDAHRGTPKVFLPLAKGRELFGNRWGEFTALRVAAPPGASPTVAGMKIATELLGSMTPAVAGLLLQEVGVKGPAAAVDFAGLLLGMSLFLMAAAVALTALLFRFHIEQRNRESGLLAAIGIAPNKVLRWRLLEGLCVVAAGTGIGALLAVAYTRFLLGLLETIWSGGGGQRLFRFHAEVPTLVGGMAGFMCLMMGVIWLVTRQQGRQGVSLRLEAGSEEVRRPGARRLPWWALGFALLGLAALAGSAGLGVAGAFFLAGCMFLLAGLALYQWVLRRRTAAACGELSPQRLADLNCGRRATRSLVVVGSLASGVFLVVAVAAFRKHSGDEWKQRGSGSGGFAYWVETTTAVNRGNGTHAANDLLGLGAARSQFGQVLPLRVGAGDDASCFNLNSVTRPRLLATDVAMLARIGAFPLKQVLAGCAKDWNILRQGEVMRAFVDETTLLWVLKKKLGERLLYQDEWGREFPVEIAGTLDGSVFQGSLVVDETRFLQHYPAAEGPRIFMLESNLAPDTGRAELQRVLADQGAAVTTTGERLAAFNSVENTYIAIFHLLGGLGVIVGSAGLGLLTARNLSERRYEFAILHSLGVPVATTRRVVLLEVRQFIRWGLGIGLLAAMISITPTLSAGGMARSLAWIGLLVAAIAANAVFWSWLGYRRQIRSALNVSQEFG
ncbi:MAG: FtsX-like permease family protein [Verrucomicrobiota bacterium]